MRCKKIANGKQCTIWWYVNENKVYHVDPKFNIMITKATEKCFGDLVIKRGRNKNFQGIEIEELDGKNE